MLDDGAPVSAACFAADALTAHAAHREAVAARAERLTAGVVAALTPQQPQQPPPLSAAEQLRLTARRLRAAKQRYAAGAEAALPASADAAEWRALLRDTDAFSQRWLSTAAAAVADAAAAGCVNVLVTAGCLLPTLAKLLLFGLDHLFPAGVIFSARREGKAACFARIAARFGPGARYLAVGDGAEEAAAARALRWPLLPVAPLAVDGALPPHAITAELLLRRLDDCARVEDAAPEGAEAADAAALAEPAEDACADDEGSG